MHKYYRSYAMEHKLQDYHRSGWSVAKKWHPSIVVSHHQSWSWCEKIRVALFIRSSKAISLWVLLTKKQYMYLLYHLCMPTSTNRQKGQGKHIFSPNQTDYLLYKKRLWREILTWNQSFKLALLYLDNAVCWCNVTFKVSTAESKNLTTKQIFCLNISIRSSFSQ